MNQALLAAFAALAVGAAPAEAQLPVPAGETVETVCAALDGCATCNADLADCEGELGTCEEELAECAACGDGTLDPWEECDAGDLGGATCDGATGGAMPHGDLRCGPGCTLDASGCMPRWVDTGLTVIDNATGLEWEKKSAGGGVRGVGATYAWTTCSGCTAPGGSAFTTFLAALNDCEASPADVDDAGGFAGHCDWRLPQRNELRSILDCSGGDPCIDPVFGPTASSYYWSATSVRLIPNFAWRADFSGGLVQGVSKHNGYHVRGVRTRSE